MKLTALRVSGLSLMLLGSFSAFSQTTDKINVVTTAVPFLRIAPDARAGGMGDVGIATSPDAASSYFNLGKVVYNENPSGLNITYTPWLKKYVNDVFLASLAGYHKLGDNAAISASLRYFSLGNIQFTDYSGQNIGSANPREFGLDLGYSRKLSDRLGLGVGLKYIYSNLAGNLTTSSTSYKAGNAVAADLGLYYTAKNEAGKGLALGAALTNLGSKIAYTDNADQKDYIPANLGIGGTYTAVFDASNKLTIGLDLNKLLVPTPPTSVDGGGPIDAENLRAYRSKGTVSSWFSSFGDADGGFSEELKEWQISSGLEYTYNNQFSLRTGYFYENKNKGNRQYFTAGVGLKYNVFGLNFSYLVPTGSSTNQNPLANTLRFSLIFDFDGTGDNSSK